MSLCFKLKIDYSFCFQLAVLVSRFGLAVRGTQKSYNHDGKIAISPEKSWDLHSFWKLRGCSRGAYVKWRPPKKLMNNLVGELVVFLVETQIWTNFQKHRIKTKRNAVFNSKQKYMPIFKTKRNPYLICKSQLKKNDDGETGKSPPPRTNFHQFTPHPTPKL